MIHGVQNVDPGRRQKLMELLDINPEWRMNMVSDGQRRRVQICMGLLKPYKASLRPAFALPWCRPDLPKGCERSSVNGQWMVQPQHPMSPALRSATAIQYSNET